MNYLLIKNGNVIFNGYIKKSDILVYDGKIIDCDFSEEIPKDCEVIDAQDKYVSPGFIDLHLHGGGGYDFMDCTVEAFEAVSKTHLLKGTTTMAPTTISAKFDDIKKFVDIYKLSEKTCGNFYGIHLEGPYISTNQKGAHKEHLLHSPTDEEIELISQIKEIKRITAAPELENMSKFVKTMVDSGVQMSIGHSDATSDIALHALRNGFSHVTHLYSATPTVRKINQVIKAGVIEAAYLDDNASVEIIADGKHAAVDAARLAVKIKGSSKVALVTDALRPAGTDVSESYLGAKIPENRVIIEDGVAKLPDRSSFAGSIATMDMILEKSVNDYGFTLEKTVEMMTKTPANILKLKDKGQIKENYVADIVVFDKFYQISYVVLNGRIIN